MTISNDAGSALDARDARPGPSDAELIAVVRGGDKDAFAELYRRHSAAAYGLARQLASSPSAADDLVAEAFAKVLEALSNGRGPDSAFRAYLLTTLRHGLYDNTRRDRRLHFTDDLTSVDPGTPFVDTAMKDLEASLVARAYAALPERWQTVLWHTEIEGQKPADIAPLLGLTANGAAALAYRAREGLRQAYLQAHLAESAEDHCRFTVERLGAWARDGLAKREKSKVEDHLETCERCRLLSGELVDVNSGLRAIIAPLVLGAPFVAGYLASLQIGAGAGLAAEGSTAFPSPGRSGSGTGAASGGAAGGSRRTALIAAIAAVAVIAVAVAGAAYAVSRGGDTTANHGGSSLGASPQASSRPTSAASPSTTSASTPSATTPTTPAPPPTDPVAPAVPPAPTPSPTSDEPSASDAPALAPLSVGVALTFNGYTGQSGTLSGAVGAAPQIRLLSTMPAGWSVTISGPCLEGGGASTVCTLPGGQNAGSITVGITAPPSTTDSPSITIGLFADAGDTAPIDSF